MAIESERFNKAEASRHRQSPALGTLLAALFASDPFPLYDLGCGNGYYLQRVWEASGGRKRCIGVDASLVIEPKAFPGVRHPIDAARAGLSLGIPGGVICIEVAEHISASRLPHLLDNLDRHCADKLVLSWALRGQGGTRHISCRNPSEVIPLLEERKFTFLPDVSNHWRAIAGQDLWWFAKSLYLFTRSC